LSPSSTDAGASGKVPIYILIGAIIGACLAVAGASVIGVTRTSVSTTTVTTTAPPGPNTNIYAPDDAVEVKGCSLSNKTCTFQITNFNMMDGYGITLGRDGMCVTVTYTPASVSSFVNEAAGCTASPSSYVANNGATTMVTAVFSDWSAAAGSIQGPAVGESIWGCILYTSGDGFGCLAFVGAFTK